MDISSFTIGRCFVLAMFPLPLPLVLFISFLVGVNDGKSRVSSKDVFYGIIVCQILATLAAALVGRQRSLHRVVLIIAVYIITWGIVSNYFVDCPPECLE